MKRKESLIIAKVIRNSSLLVEDKVALANTIAKELFKVDQFFDRKGFITIATMGLNDNE